MEDRELQIVLPANSCKKKGKGKKERQWKDEEVEELISLYEERVCLWDVNQGSLIRVSVLDSRIL